MRLLAALVTVLSIPVPAAERAAAMARALREMSFDPEQCYRVRDIALVREDIKLFFTEGFLLFARPVNGASIAAVFSAATEGGDAEVLLLPPSSSERMSLAAFTESPNLGEHFQTAVLLFTDDTAAVLRREIERGEVRKSEEMGALLAGRFDGVVRNLAASFEIRLVQDLVAPFDPSRGFFYAAIAGNKLGNFDVVYDPMMSPQISAGQLTNRDNRTYFDTWTTFDARSFRRKERDLPAPDTVSVSNVRLEASLEPDLHLRVITRATLRPRAATAAPIGFDLSRKMRITSVLLDGQPVEFFQRESMRSNLIRGNDSDVFLVVPAEPLQAGRDYEILFEHDGDVINKAGNNVYYVSARGSWYPQHGMTFTLFDLTFRYPRQLHLAATGDVIEDRTEGETRITRHRTPSPVRMMAFNLGEYDEAKASRGNLRVHAFSNRRVEAALQPRMTEMILMPTPPTAPFPRRRTDAPVAIPVVPREPDPSLRLARLADEIADCFAFMTASFGPPPLTTLQVSPIPGAFGQGFPGLLYLSTLTYLDPKDRPLHARTESQQMFFSELLHAHETAHQWWGNLVASKSASDGWLMEALANYSALLHLERRKGARALDQVLDEYRNHLVRRDDQGSMLDAAGPIIWGPRLHSSHAPLAWRIITYEKGSWIMHMLRRRLGDKPFLSMLRALCEKFARQAISTEEFRRHAARYVPSGSPDPELELFFDTWVYGTGIPTLRLTHRIQGRPPALRLTGAVTQTDAGADFEADVPIVIQTGRTQNVTHWVRTGSEPATFDIRLKVPPVKVLLDPYRSVLQTGW